MIIIIIHYCLTTEYNYIQLYACAIIHTLNAILFSAVKNFLTIIYNYNSYTILCTLTFPTDIFVSLSSMEYIVEEGRGLVVIAIDKSGITPGNQDTLVLLTLSDGTAIGVNTYITNDPTHTHPHTHTHTPHTHTQNNPMHTHPHTHTHTQGVP